MRHILRRPDFHEQAKKNGYVRKNGPKAVFRNLKRAPDVVVDVGVRGGTKWLYAAFPDVRFVLVDPQKEDEWVLRFKPKTYEIVTKGLSDRVGQMELLEEGGKSTFHTCTELTSAPVRDVYYVDVVTFDQMADDLALKGSIGVKIDVEGHELKVLQGIKKYRASIDFIVAEMSILNRFEDAPNFSDIVAELRDMGFRFYNIMNHARAKAPLHYDGLFLKDDDPAFDALERLDT